MYWLNATWILKWELGERGGGKNCSVIKFPSEWKALKWQCKSESWRGAGETMIGAVFKKSVCSRNEGGAAGLACSTGSDTAVATGGLCATFKVQWIVTSKADYGKMQVSLFCGGEVVNIEGTILPPKKCFGGKDPIHQLCSPQIHRLQLERTKVASGSRVKTERMRQSGIWKTILPIWHCERRRRRSYSYQSLCWNKVQTHWVQTQGRHSLAEE